MTNEPVDFMEQSRESNSDGKVKSGRLFFPRCKEKRQTKAAEAGKINVCQEALQGSSVVPKYSRLPLHVSFSFLVYIITKKANSSK